MARRNQNTSVKTYDPNGKYRALKILSRHPEATHPDGLIRPDREGPDFHFTMAHRKPEEVKILVDQQAIEPVEA